MPCNFEIIRRLRRL